MAFLSSLVFSALGQGLTVQIGSAPLPPTPLAASGDSWHFQRGTNAPQAAWQTSADAILDASWQTGPGGFGYSTDTAGETLFCQTLLPDMLNGYSTFYLRQSFEITEAVDPSRRLQLVLDYDDGFVAWLDGAHVARSSNAPGAPDSEPPYTAISLPPNHESSRGTSGNPPLTNDLGLVGSRLQPGTHILAIMGLNGTLGSSDFILVPDLRLVGGQGAATEGAFFALVSSNVVSLSGSNTLAGSTRVVVNGLDASYDPATRIWSRTQSLAPGWNDLFIAALDAQGNVLAATNKAVVAELASTSVGGVLPGNTAWTTAMGTVRVTNDVTVPAGVTLTIDPGVVILLSPTASIRATTNGVVSAQGTESAPVYFVPADGTTQWRELSARGAGASMTLGRVELIAGQVIAHPSGAVTIEDSFLRDFRSGSRLFLTATNAASFALRRSHVTRYDQIRFSGTPIRIEDSLLEYIGSDATDLADHSDIQVRHTTYRFGAGSNTDALDLGNNPGILIENCLIHDMPDKGVSVAESSGITVRHSLLYNNGIGIACYASSDCLFYQNTLANCTAGLSLYTRAGFTGPGLAFATNNIVWGSTTNVHLAAGGSVELTYSDVQGGWPGAGNIDSDPLFLSVPAGDFRLSSGSPAQGTGLGAVNMGAVFPVGGLPPAPFNLAAHATGIGPIQVWWQEDADNEAGFAIERSIDGDTWEQLSAAGLNVTNFTDASALLGQVYFYRVQATNSSGASRFSNVASAIRQPPVILAGGVLTSNTVWSPAHGTVLVLSNVIVPTNITLSIETGALVRLTNQASLIAQAGGMIRIEGTAEAPVVLQRWNGANNWGELRADGTNAWLLVRHADVSGGQTTVNNGATAVLEDSYFHSFHQQGATTTFNQPLLLAHFAQPTLVRGCHFDDYYEVLLRNGIYQVEDCLFEHMDGDALDFDAAQTGTVVRHCTFRHGDLGNVDAIDVGNGDLGGSRDVVIEGCLMYDFPFDKGVSIGDAGASSGTVVRNSLIYGCRSGVQVKDNCIATVYNCTIVSNAWGFTNYNKINPGSATGGGNTWDAHNNILWDDRITISMWNGSTLSADHCNFGGTNWPPPNVAGPCTNGICTNNISVNPLFVNEAQRDYRLQTNSPCRGAGRDGADLGASLPVGAPMAPSNPYFEVITRLPAGTSEATQVTLRFWADSERSYTVESSSQASGGVWTGIRNVFPDTLPRKVTITDTIDSGAHRFYRLVSPARP
jgi:parallel beta-helix repeat protein